MRLRALLIPALTTGLLFTATAHSANAPQVTDAAGDANFLNNQGTKEIPNQSGSVPGINQAYADVLSILWEKAKVKGKPAFKVTLTLSAAPTPPSGTQLVYRMLGTPACDEAGFFGVVFYTMPQQDIPQSGVRDSCTGETVLTPIDLPVIKDATITWTVPISKLPKPFKFGDEIKNLRAEVREIENFRPVCIPDNPLLAGPTCGLGTGQLDAASSTNSYKLGK